MKTLPLLRLAGKFLPIVMIVVLLLAAGAAPRVAAAPGSAPDVPFAGDQVIINEIYRGTTLSGTGNEWIEVVLTKCLSATQLEGFYVGDSTSATESKFSGYRFTNMSSIAATFPAGTIIVVGGSASVTQNVSYDPTSGDWNILLQTSSSTYLTGNGSNGDLAATDVAYVDTNGTNGNTTLSASGFAVRWGATVGTFGGVANVAITAPANPGVMALTSDKDGATTPANWVVQTTTLGGPNGSANTTWITSLRSAGCPDAPPQVSSHSPTAGATGVAVSSNITINFNEVVDVTSAGVTLECPAGTPVAFGGLGASDVTSVTLDPTSDLPNGVTCTVTAVATGITDNDGTVHELDGDGNGTGGDNYSFTFTTAAANPCTQAATPIHDIQGSGTASSMTGQSKTIQGVVVGDFEVNGLKGFFVQEENGDADPLTSEGIFVWDNNETSEVVVGDIVRLTGTVNEYADRTVGGGTLTELSSPSSLLNCGTGTVTAASVSLPETTNGDLERYEGMKVSIASAMTVSQNYFVGRYGQMTLSSGGRMYQPTNQYTAGSANAIALADENVRRTLILDDGMALDRCGDNPNPAPYLGGPPPAVIRAGDSVSSLVGVLDYGQIDSGETGGCSASGTLFTGDYRLHPTQAPAFTTQNARPASPPSVGGSIKVVSANALNFFNGNGAGGGFPTSRGANTFTEFVRQRIKFYEELSKLSADVVALAEIENDGYGSTSAIAELVKVMNQGPCWNSASECSTLGYSNSGMGADTYAFIDADTLTGESNALGTDEIKVGLIYKPGTVTPVGTTAALNSTTFVNGGDSAVRNRPALAQAFEVIGSGERFVVAANHFKSKGSACDAPDAGDGQGNCNTVRSNAASALVSWLNTDPTKTAEPDALIVGDLNSYAKEDPILVLTNAGYTNLIGSFVGSTAYSYIFDGQSGYLDHALSSSSLTPQVTGAADWHVNADEPAVIDYNTEFNPSGYYATNQYRSADHDPVSVGLNLATTDDLSDHTGYGATWHSSSGLQLGATWGSGHAPSAPAVPNDSGTNDGVIGFVGLDPNWASGGGYITVDVRGVGASGACVYGWIDWNQNNSFADSGEASTPAFTAADDAALQVAWAAPTVFDGVAPNPRSYNLRLRVVPGACGSHLLAGAEAAAQTNAPLGPSANLPPTGGEVEDHTLSFTPTAIHLAGLHAAPATARPLWLLALAPGLGLGLAVSRRRPRPGAAQLRP